MTVTSEQLRNAAASGAGSSQKPQAGSAREANIVDTTPVRAVSGRYVTRISSKSPWYETGLGELARAHELLFAVTWRQIGVQYKQAILGIGWAVISPLMNTVVFTLIFGKLAAIPSEGLPYPLFVLSGLITWQYFARAVTTASNSIVANSHIITKAYFPRMILPLSGVLAGLVDYLINLAVLLVLMAVYGRAPGAALLLLPVFLLAAMMMAFAISLWLSALNALYRDIAFIIPLALQAWMFLTPVIYPGSLVPHHWAWLLQLNPMTVVVQGGRWAALPGAAPPDPLGLAIFAVEFFLLFVGGVAIFHKIDAVVADRI